MAFARILFWISAVISVVTLIFMMLMTDADVLMRQLFNKSIFGAVELTNYALAVLIGAGLVTAVRDRSHICVDLFSHHITRRFPRAHRAWLAAFNVLGILIIALLMFMYGIKKLQDKELSFLLEFQVGLVFIASGVLCFAAFIVQLIYQIASIKDQD